MLILLLFASLHYRLVEALILHFILVVAWVVAAVIWEVVVLDHTIEVCDFVAL